MKRIVVIGAGFAGTSALCVLSGSRRSHEVILVDGKKSSCCLPLLPDCIGRGIQPRHTVFDLESFCRQKKVSFLQRSVEQVSLRENVIFAAGQRIPYDYLIIASGSQTNFYGNKLMEKSVLKLDDQEDAAAIFRKACDPSYEHYIVSGAGYTGIEIATNLKCLLDKNKRKASVLIVEKAPSILGPLPEWMKEYVADNLAFMNIRVQTATSIERVDNDEVVLSSKEVLRRACVIWAAGVRTAGFLQELPNEKNPQGRLKVDEHLRVAENCFVAGDASLFNDEAGYLRMAVQFAITQGECAARNCLRLSRGRIPVKYRPFDFGYIIPMANNRACGRVMGMNMKGLLPIFLHYLMCIYRSRGLGNRWGIMGDLLKGGRLC